MMRRGRKPSKYKTTCNNAMHRVGAKWIKKKKGKGKRKKEGKK